VAALYMQQETLGQPTILDALCEVVVDCQKVERMAPKFGSMREDCDAELFMVLPRLVLLCYLADPAGCRVELVRHLLPHRFVASPTAQGAPCSEIKGFIRQYSQTAKMLMAAGLSSTASQEVLMKRALSGELAGATERGVFSVQVYRSIDVLMHALERWSLELQRHCPEDWNQFSAVLLRCLQGTPGEPQVHAPNVQVEFQP